MIITGKILNVKSDEDEESISDPELNLTSVEDGESALLMDSVNFMGTAHDYHELARKEHFDDQPFKSYFSDENVICNVSKVDMDSIWDLNPEEDTSGELHNLVTDDREDLIDWDLDL